MHPIHRAAYRWAAGLALAGALGLVWLSLGVGLIGRDGDPVNRLYLGVLAVRIVSAKTFYRIAYASVFVVGLKLTWDGVFGLIG